MSDIPYDILIVEYDDSAADHDRQYELPQQAHTNNIRNV